MRVRAGYGAEIRNYEKHALCFLRVVSRKKEELPVIESSFTLYKLIILYMLQNVNFPLSNTQISDFILEKEYTNYYHLQEALS